MEFSSIKLPPIKDLNGTEIQLSYPHLKYGKKGTKLLVITDTITREEKDSQELFSGDVGAIVKNAYELAITYGKKEPSETLFVSSSCSWGKISDAEKDQDTQHTIERIVKLISKYKPDVIVFMGYRHLSQWRDNAKFPKVEGRDIADDELKDIRGRLFDIKVGTHKCQAMFTFSAFNFASLNPKTFGSDVNLIGFVVRDFELAINGKNWYTIPQPNKKRWFMIDTLKKFDRLLELMQSAKVVSIDTEGKNLNRVYGNILYTVQVTMDGVDAFLIPYMHPKTPFLPKELEHIRIKLKDYFENGSSKWHIYQNAKFDLLMFFAQLRLEYYNHRIWDISVGEMNLDENRKFFRMAKFEAYTLKALSAKYGSFGYANTAIGKEDRGNMAKFSLEEILEYGVIDVLNPYWIAIFQIEEAQRRGPSYKNYKKAVCEIGSDKILSFVEMERNGLPVDKDYLVSQLAPNSPLNVKLNEEETKFKKFDSVRKLNALLCKEAGIPTTGRGFLGKHKENEIWLFKTNKEAHLQRLFFNVLKLEPLAMKKGDKGGKTDKAFIAEYGSKVPEVASFSDIRKIKALINSFVKGILKDIVNSEDNKDNRIRSVYDFIRIITGRSGSRSPNLQNVPSRGPLAYIIKRMFLARRTFFMIKADMSSHEVRLWGMLSRDPAMAEAFGVKLKAGRNMRIALLKDIELDYRLFKFLKDVNWKKIETPEEKRAWVKKLHNKDHDLSKALEYMLAFEAADLHRVNYNAIYGKDPLAVTKSERNEFKSVIFGAIYERSARTLAITDLYINDVRDFTWELIKKTIKVRQDSEQAIEARKKYNKQIKPFVEKAQKLIDTLFGRFKRGAEWLGEKKEQVEEVYHTVSIFGNVRHLWGLLHTDRSVHGKSIRRGPNSAVQGAASDCVYSGARQFRKWVWQAKKNGFDIPVLQCNAVHDSSELEANIELIPIILYVLEHSYTTLVHRRLRDCYGFDPYISLEIDAEFGPHLGDLTECNWSEAVFLNAISEGIDWQIKEKGYDLNKKKIMKKVKHNWRTVNSYRLKELNAMQKGEDHAPSYEMLITPENVGEIGLLK